MSAVLNVGGEQIDGSKHALVKHDIDHINHWSGRKAGDSKKIIAHDSKIFVVITNWISHAISHEAQCDQARH